MAREIEEVILGGKNGTKAMGKLKIAEAGIGWKNSVTGKIHAVPADDIHKLSWQRCARDYQLRVQTNDGDVLKFDNLPKELYESIAPLTKNFYSKILERKEISLKGWNWGSVEFQGNQMGFNVSNHPAFEVPLGEVANTNLPLRNEVSVEFVLPEIAAKDIKRKGAQEDTLTEIRLFVPGAGTQSQVVSTGNGVQVFKDKDQTEGEKAENGDGDEETAPDGGDGEQLAVDGDGTVLSSASLLCETIKQKADFGGGVGEPIASFENILCLTPRGRFEVELHLDFFRLRGKSHDYKILFSSIITMALLPKPDDLHYMFVIGLDPPLRQGQTRYPFLVFQFEREEEVELDLNMEPEIMSTTYEDRLKKAYDGPIYEVISEIIKGLSGKRITAPSDIFRSSQGQSGIKCANKANEAYLYLLEKSILSIPKPPIFIAHNEISAVTFSRVAQAGGSTLKTFEIKFNLRDGPDYTFSSIAREESEPLEAFFRAKNMKVLTEEPETARAYVEDSDVDSENDAPRSRVKEVPTGGNIFDQEDEGSSEDEDFAPGNESDVAEEFDEAYAGSQSEGEDGAPPPKAKGSDASDESEIEEVVDKPKAAKAKRPRPESASSSSKAPAKKKAKKEGPKRGMTSFLYFSKDKRPEILADAPGLALPEVAKKLGELWKSVSQEEKAKYEEMAKVDKERYQDEKAEFDANGGGGKEQEGSSEKKAPKTKAKPKSVSKEPPSKYKSEEFVESDSD
ncbi:FACT complex subunit [Thoreauomyces humboldtii]|nr:FACT complex subunit [Thoreauomyces humboldtii]